MAESGVTIPSDSEQYSGAEDVSTSPPSSSSPAVILYQPPTIWSLLRGATINLFLPFINGMMLGFGELFAHEAAFRLGWSGTRVSRALDSGRPAYRVATFYREPNRHSIALDGHSQAISIDTANGMRQVFPLSRRQAHSIGPGIEAVDKPRGRNTLDDLTSLE